MKKDVHQFIRGSLNFEITQTFIMKSKQEISMEEMFEVEPLIVEK